MNILILLLCHCPHSDLKSCVFLPFVDSRRQGGPTESEHVGLPAFRMFPTQHPTSPPSRQSWAPQYLPQTSGQHTGSPSEWSTPLNFVHASVAERWVGLGVGL